MEYNIIYLSGGRQKSYLAAARRVIWRPLEEINYLAAARRVIWRPPEELSGGRQKSYLAAARRVIWRPPEELSGGLPDKLSGGRQIIIWRPPEELRGSVKITECFLVSPKPLNVTKTLNLVMKLRMIKIMNGISAIE